MARRFDGKTVFITGASSGIGAELGKAFAREGANVALTARRVDRLESLCAAIAAEGGKALAIAADVTDRESLDGAVARAIETYGALDVAVANAGFGVMGAAGRMSTEDVRRQFETNFFGLVDTFYATLPHLIASKGRFAAMSSVAGRVASPRTPVYNASKFAVNGFCEGAYYELADNGVSLTLIMPGFVDTEIHRIDKYGRYREDSKGIAPPWIMMPAPKAARIMVHAIHKRKPEIVVTGHGKAFVFLNRHFPRTVRTLFRLGSRGKLRARG